MRVLVLEAVCAGLCGDAPADSLLREGAAMWQAAVEDFGAIPGVAVTTCLAEELRERLSVPAGVDVFWSSQPAEWSAWWEGAVVEADAVLVIAPETDGLQVRLCRPRAAATALRLNCDPAAIELCTDKWALAAHCQRHDIPTIPTERETWRSPPPEAREWVVKPRDGAGAWLVQRLHSHHDWGAARRRYLRELPQATERTLRQPWIAGRALSLAGLFYRTHPPEWLPIAEQSLVLDEDAVHYRGGRVPARLDAQSADAVKHVAQRAAATIPGLYGYVGFDLVLPDAHPAGPLLVEINPRLTTSYVGYRRLCAGSLCAHWLTRALAVRRGGDAALLTDASRALAWRDVVVNFSADGGVVEEPA